jgi:hypothetical protein
MCSFIRMKKPLSKIAGTSRFVSKIRPSNAEELVRQPLELTYLSKRNRGSTENPPGPSC